MEILSFLRSIEIPENYVLLISIAISSLLSAVLQLANELMFVEPVSQWIIMLCAFLISIIVSFLLAKFSNCDSMKKVMRSLENKSINDNIWRDVVDYENGTKILVSLIGSDYGYLGFFLEIEEKGPDSWFALTDWNKVKLNENDEVITSFKHTGDPAIKSSIVLRLSDVKSATLFYGKDTRVYLGRR